MNAISPSPVENSPASHDLGAVQRNLDFEFLIEWSAMAASLWRSAEEAAFRGDVITFAVHLRQARLVAFTVTRALEKVAGTDGEARHE